MAGPNITRLTGGLGLTPFLYSYVTLALLGIPALMVVARLQIPKPSPAASGATDEASRPLAEITRFGLRPVIATGICLLIVQVLIALAGIQFMHFVASLILLGVGWNFLFVGGTTMLTQAYRPGEQARTQAAHDFLMFVATSIASFSAGGLLNAGGWQAVNLVALPLLALAAGVLLCVSRR